MVGQGHLNMKNQICRFAGNLLRTVVFAGHHEFSTFLADLLEDPVVAPLQKFVGVTARFRALAARHDHPGQLGADIGWGRQGRGTASRGQGTLVVEAAAGPRMASHLAPLLNREQQHIGVAVVTNSPQPLEVATAGPLVPQLLARAAPVVHLPRGQAAFDRLPVHPGLHQNRPIEPVLGDRWNQASFVKAQLLQGQVQQGTGHGHRHRRD